MRRWNVILAMCAAVAGGISARAIAGDPGDLFPEVDYGRTVRSPVKQPDQSLTGPSVTRVRPATPRRATPRAELPIAATKPTEPATLASSNVTPETKPDVKSEPKVAQTEGGKLWAPYSDKLLKTLLSPSEQAEFDKDFAPAIKKALDGTSDDRKRAMDTLTESAATRTAGLRRYLLLHVVGMAIKNSAPLEDRSARAMRVLPQLTEATLAVAQAKADCLHNLAHSATQNATDKLWAMLAEAQANLAKLQVQAAFPKEAADTLRKARDTFGRMKDKNVCHSELIAEAQAWVDYATTGTNALPDLKSALSETPKDAAANTQVAALYLVLYADLDAAQEYAENGRADLRAFSDIFVKVKFPELSADHKMLSADSLRIAGALLEVAKASPVQIERYALATLVTDRLNQLKLLAGDSLDAAPWDALHVAARLLAERNAFKPLAAATKPADPAPTTAPVDPQPPAPTRTRVPGMGRFRIRPGR